MTGCFRAYELFKSSANPRAKVKPANGSTSNVLTVVADWIVITLSRTDLLQRRGLICVVSNV